MIRYFMTTKESVKPFKNIELTEEQVKAEIGNIIAEEYDGPSSWDDDYNNDYEQFADKREAEMLKETLTALDIGDCIIYGREDSNYDDISLESYGTNRRPVYVKDGIEYDTLEEAIKA